MGFFRNVVSAQSAGRRTERGAAARHRIASPGPDAGAHISRLQQYRGGHQHQPGEHHQHLHTLRHHHQDRGRAYLQNRRLAAQERVQLLQPGASPRARSSFDGSITNHGHAGNATTGSRTSCWARSRPPATSSPATDRPPQLQLGIFFQDDWQVTPKLTINARPPLRVRVAHDDRQ